MLSEQDHVKHLAECDAAEFAPLYDTLASKEFDRRAAKRWGQVAEEVGVKTTAWELRTLYLTTLNEHCFEITDRQYREADPEVKTGTFSEKVREIMRRSGLSNGELAAAAGVDKGVISRFLRGERSLTLDTFDRLADVLRIDPKVTR